MQPLIPSLQDAQQAADALRQGRWPAGVACPRCGRDAVEPRDRCDNGLRRFPCGPCAARWGPQLALCTAWTRAIFEESTWRPRAWWRGLGWWPWQLTATALAAAAAIPERTAQRCSNVRAGGLYETYPLDPTRPLAPQGAADACSPSAGRQGLARAVARGDRAPRPRGMQRRGRAPAATGRPPLLGLGQRRAQAAQDAPAAQGSLEVLEQGCPATSQPLLGAKAQGGAPCFTAEDNLSHCTKADYAQRTVKHGAGASARRALDGPGVPCHPLAGLWSGLRQFLAPFQGISQRFLPLRVGRDEFLHNQTHLHWDQTFETALRYMCSTPGAYGRQMTHQHRRMPLTLCYR